MSSSLTCRLGSMVPELRSIQEKFGYLPAEQLESLATELGVPLSQIHAVASFYPHFHLTPPARIDVRVCSDMSCHLRGGDDLRRQLERAFRGTSPQTLAIRDVSCLGRCDQAPALCVNEAIYGNMDGARAVSMLQEILTGGPLPAESSEIEPVQLAMDPYKGSRAYGVVKHLVETRNVNGVIAALKASRAARPGRGRISHRHEVGDCAQRARRRKVHRVQCR